MIGIDLIGAADAGFSIPALWKLMNTMRPMSKAQADALLSAGISADDLAAKYLTGSDAVKAQAHLEAMQNTRVSVSNEADDPLNDAVASGVRTMTADAFTHANTFYNSNQAGAANLDALFADMKSNAAALPKTVFETAVAAVKAVTSPVKWVLIGAGVLVVLVGGAYVYKAVRT